MRRRVVLTALAALALFCVPPGFAQQPSDEVKKELEALKAGQARVEKELQDIKSLLQARPLPSPGQPSAGQPQNVILGIDGAPFKGDKNAKVTLIEYTDYQCPFCARHVHDTWPQIEKDYISTGKLKYVVRDFPLESIHPQAFKAAEAADCAGDQGKFWEMHDRLFANQRGLGAKELPEHGKALGLDPAKFEQCLESGKYAEGIRKGQAEAQRLGVTGTPSFFLGLTEPGSNTVKAVRKLTGAQPYPAFQAAFEELLSGAK